MNTSDDDYVQERFIVKRLEEQHVYDDVSEQDTDREVADIDRRLNKAREKARVGLAIRYEVSWSEHEPVFHSKGRLKHLEMQDMVTKLIRDITINEIRIVKNLYVNDELVDIKSFRHVMNRVSLQGTIAEKPQ